jgi:hypothetical protein
MPEHVILKKNELFLKKQENIIKFEELTEELKTTRKGGKYHMSNALPSDEKKVRFACEGCHSNYPHKMNKETRAFFNMHSFRISCLTCHIAKKDMNKVKIGWFDIEENFRNNGKNLENTRITPYIIDDSFEFILEKGINNHDDLKKRFKINIARRKDLKCNACHIKKGRLLLDLQSLGYTTDEITILRNLDETTLFNRKESWTYPDFL